MTCARSCIADHIKRKLPTILFALLLSFGLATSCPAQAAPRHEKEKPEEERSASESHSYMELFTKLERDWIQAAQKKDKTALDAMVAREFMLRTSESPESPQPRADWIQHALTSYDVHSFSQRAIAIRAFLGVAVVSFVQSEQSTMDGKDHSGDYFIVDLWEAKHDKWQVCARYMAPAGNHPGGETKTKPQK